MSRDSPLCPPPCVSYGIIRSGQCWYSASACGLRTVSALSWPYNSEFGRDCIGHIMLLSDILWYFMVLFGTFYVLVLQVKKGYYSLPQLASGYYRLINVTTDYSRLLNFHCFFLIEKFPVWPTATISLRLILVPFYNHLPGVLLRRIPCYFTLCL